MKNLYKNNENEMNRHLKFVYMSYNRSSLKWNENESGGQKSSIVHHLQIPLKTHFFMCSFAFDHNSNFGISVNVSISDQPLHNRLK